MSFLTISFMFHDSQVVRNEIIKSIIFSSFKRSFQPINLFVGVVLGYISPIAFPKECSYLWWLSMIKFSPSHLGEEVFFSLLISIQSTISVVAEFRLYLEKFSISPLQAYSFRCWFFSNNSVLTFLEGCFPRSLVAEVGIFFSILYSKDLSSIIYFFRRHCDVALFTPLLVLRIMFFSCLSISNRSVVPSFQVLPILSSFASLINRSAV